MSVDRLRDSASTRREQSRNLKGEGYRPFEEDDVLIRLNRKFFYRNILISLLSIYSQIAVADTAKRTEQKILFFGADDRVPIENSENWPW